MNPRLAELTDKVLFGSLWEHPALSKRDRSLVTVTVLAVLGHHEQLQVHLRRALDNGVTRSELDELMVHLAFYAGWPAGTSAALACGVVYATEDDSNVA
ncbi:carboxymuconolactone decarboxylase family protein [Verticiella sediminum]|uniref:carboxymuconolactone decarboxylase family protein n=1 Tax=Verticiella sediminum TaxID=1247510 RepID=UPI001FE61704|nr:carboxymuconolactone decarboxylase family protein [Verticiella sediminum]